MPGGLMQLTAYGAQDLYLTGNPDITFFKYVYRRYSNFSMEYIDQTFLFNPDFTVQGLFERTSATCKINRNADLLYDGYIAFKIPALFTREIDSNRFNIAACDLYNISYINQDSSGNANSDDPAVEKDIIENQVLMQFMCNEIIPTIEPVSFVDNLGNNLIYSVEITINGQTIDLQYGKWLTIWNELTLTVEELNSYNNMSNSDILTTEYTADTFNETDYILLNPSKLIYIPLPFWFCKNPGLAIPLIALQYSEIYINVEFNSLNNIIKIGNPKLSPDFFFNSAINPDFDYHSQIQVTQSSEDATTGTINEAYININNPVKYFTENSFFNSVYRRYLVDNYTVDTTNIFNRYAVSWKPDTYLIMNYIYLSDDERIRFAQNSHEYLITQTQSKEEYGLQGGLNIVDISSFNHPVKELVWVLQRPEVNILNDWDNYILIDTNHYKSIQVIKELNNNLFSNPFLADILSIVQTTSGGSTSGTSTNKRLLSNLCAGHQSLFTEAINLVTQNIEFMADLNPEIIQLNNTTSLNDILQTSQLVFNGVDRFIERDANFFSNVQAYKYHKNNGLPGTYIYSFALNPEDDQPSGTCNMSRLTTVELKINIVSVKNKGTQRFNAYIYATNYNVLRIMSGMGSLAFSN